MKSTRLLSGVAVGMFTCLVLTWRSGAQTTGPAPTPSSDAPNVAIVATPSSSFVSGDTSLAALNDGSNPRNSRTSRGGTYGNWPRRGNQWVQYDWGQPISTKQIDVFWWADGQGVNLPASCKLKYWNGTDWADVPNGSGLGVQGNQWNSTTFDEVQTSKLRLEFDSQEN